ncbi:MAG: hypothetical protein DRR16_00430 [Candidatus Parabeggiatoa sp. nov. 3]|nr:MAG: hypothetical protein DRQ99_10325 [Gammaproteobacteria bacterium]RKZ90166.1 MAG: hypothetical protein DRR16_00430 [Gammaproteobacteria bacterium]
MTKLAASQPKASVNWVDRKNVWGKQADILYKKVQTWLSEHSKGGHIKFNSSNKVTLSDPNVGDYDMPSLELSLVGGHQIIFSPIEMDFLGAAGRIDLSHRGNSTHKTMLLLFIRGNSYQWELWKGLSKEDQQSFNKETLEGLLEQWIES